MKLRLFPRSVYRLYLNIPYNIELALVTTFPILSLSTLSFLTLLPRHLSSLTLLPQVDVT